jgi:general stress protein YciG
MKQIRGFAAMSKEKRTAIARRGGLAVASEKRTYSKDPLLASIAGRKGGERAAIVRAAWAKAKKGQHNGD